MRTFSHPKSKDISMMISVGEYQMLTGHEDGSIRLWSISSKERDSYDFRLDAEFLQHEKAIRHLTLADNRFIAVSVDETLSIWNIDSETCEKILKCSDNKPRIPFSSANSIALLPNNLLAIGGYCSDAWGGFDVWDLVSGECIFQKPFLFHRPGSIMLTTIKGYLTVYPEYGGTFALWKINAQQCIQISETHADRIYSLATTSDEEIITGGFGLSLYNVLETGKVIPSDILPYPNDNVIDILIPLADTFEVLTISRKYCCSGTIELKDYIAQTSRFIDISKIGSEDIVAGYHIFSPGYQLIIAAGKTEFGVTPLSPTMTRFAPVITPLTIL